MGSAYDPNDSWENDDGRGDGGAAVRDDRRHPVAAAAHHDDEPLFGARLPSTAKVILTFFDELVPFPSVTH